MKTDQRLDQIQSSVSQTRESVVVMQAETANMKKALGDISQALEDIHEEFHNINQNLSEKVTSLDTRVMKLESDREDRRAWIDSIRGPAVSIMVGGAFAGIVTLILLTRGFTPQPKQSEGMGEIQQLLEQLLEKQMTELE